MNIQKDKIHKFSKEDAIKGGSKRSVKKTRANRLNPVKHGRYSKYFTQEFLELLRNPDKFDSLMSTHLMEN